MADVHVLPGVERRDIGDDVAPADVLRCAIENGVTDAIVVGKARDGSLYLAAESSDADLVVGKLMRAATFLATHEVKQK